MKDITAQNVTLHLQENMLKAISFCLYPLLFLAFLFPPPLLMCFTLSKMQFVILKKKFKVLYLSCPFPILFAKLLQTSLVSTIYGTTTISTRNNNNNLILAQYNSLWLLY